MKPFYRRLKPGMAILDSDVVFARDNEMAEGCLGVTMGQLRVIQRLIKTHPVVSKVMHADDPEMLQIHTMPPLKHLVGTTKGFVAYEYGITEESIDFDLIALKTIFPPINVSLDSFFLHFNLIFTSFSPSCTPVTLYCKADPEQRKGLL